MIAAIFDFDGTFVDARVWQSLLRYQWQKRVNVLPLMAYVACHYALYPAVRSGALSDATFRRLWARDMPWTVAGLRPERAAEVFAGVVERDLLPATRPAVLDRLRWHRAQGHHTVILSGAFEPLLTAYAGRLRLGNVAGTVLATYHGRYTGRIDGPLCFGEGKVTRLKQYFDTNMLEIDLAASYAYADSHTDLPVLEAVGHPVVVEPDEQLRHHARDRGWALL